MFIPPLALIGVPLPMVLVHVHFNLIFQFWIHTETIGKCGPIEWIFNTPSHHRVHHGSNPWCLDKNYGAYLIIWDRIFGTFEAERDNETIVYGLVSQPQTYNVFNKQIFHMKELFQKCLAQETFSNKLQAIFYGPGWLPGTPRLGYLPNEEHLKRDKYDPKLSPWLDVYFLLHGLITLYSQQLLVNKSKEFSAMTFTMTLGYICLFVGIVGGMYDGRKWAPHLEMVRCGLCLAYCCYIAVTPFLWLDNMILAYFVVSTLIWTANSLGLIPIHAIIVKKM